MLSQYNLITGYKQWWMYLVCGSKTDWILPRQVFTSRACQ